MSRPATGSVVEVSIEALAFGGSGVGRVEDFVIFVDGALPGDTVTARIRRVKHRYAQANVAEVISPGPHRVDAPCPHFGRCGGCRWQHLAYAQQLVWKHQQVRDALERIGHQDGFELAPIIPADQQLAYRNKIELSFADSDDGAVLGFHRAGRWQDIEPISTCLLVGEPENEIRRTVQAWARTAQLRALDRRRGGGYLRHLIIRGSARTDEQLAVLVTGPGPLPQIDDLTQRLGATVPSLVGLLHAETDGVAETTQGINARVVYGRDWYRETVAGLTLRVSAFAFLQTNTAMCERLYEAALRACALTSTDVVYDLYCGTGTIALLCARHAGRVVGIEANAESIDRARDNARANAIANTTFIHGQVEHVLADPGQHDAPAPSVVVVDPPRAGLTPKALRGVIAVAPRRLVYVSCNPTTLAGNAESLTANGYRLGRVEPLDMFPHTHHVECVAVFDRDA